MGAMTAVMWFRRDLRLADNPALVEAPRPSRGDGVLPLFVLDPALWGPAGISRRLLPRRRAARAGRLDPRPQGRRPRPPGRPRRPGPAGACWRPGRSAPSGCTSPPTTAPTAPAGTRRSSRALGRARRRAGPHRVAVRRRAGPGDQGRRDAVRRVHAVTARPGRPTAGAARSTRRAASTSLALDDTTDIPDPARPDGLTLPTAGEAAARRRWQSFLDDRLGDYARDRDKPGVPGTSHMSVHLKWGEIHPRTMLADLGGRSSQGATTLPLGARLARVLRRRAPPPTRHRARLPQAGVRPDGLRRARATSSSGGSGAAPASRSSTPGCASCGRPAGCTTGCG